MKEYKWWLLTPKIKKIWPVAPNIWWSKNRYLIEKFSGAIIEPATTNVYTVEDHIITCKLTDVPAQIYGVTWTTEARESNGYVVTDGTFNPDTKSQVSTLSISSVKLVELRRSGVAHSFTCKITVGDSNTEVKDIQTITIFNPSKSFVQIKWSENALAALFNATYIISELSYDGVKLMTADT